MTTGGHDVGTLAARSPARAWWGLAAVLFTAFVATTAGVIGAVTAPEQVAEFGSNIQAAGLSSALALAVSAALLVPAGRLADRYGHKRTWLYGAALLVVSQLAVGTARSADALWVLKVLQGLAFAIVMPSVLALTLTLFPPGRRRAVAIASWTTVTAVAVAVAPLWAGFFAVEPTGWRGAYLVGAAATVVPIVVGWFVLADNRALDRTVYEGFDLPGTLWLVAWCVTFVVFLEQGRYFGWLRPAGTLRVADAEIPVTGVAFTPVLLVLTVLLVWAFVRTERRRNARRRVAVVERSLVRHRTFRAGIAGLALLFFASYGVLYVTPVYLATGLGLSPLTAGASVAAIGAGVLAGAQGVNIVGRRLPLRAVVGCTVLLQPAALAVLALSLRPATPVWLVTLLLFVYGVGWGASNVPITNLIYQRIPARLTGAATGTQLAARVLAGAVGTAVLGTAMTVVVVEGLRDATSEDRTLSVEQRRRLVASVDETVVSPSSFTSRGQQERPVNGSIVVPSPSGVAFALSESEFRAIYARGVRTALWIATLVSVLGVVAVSAIPRDETWTEFEEHGFERVANAPPAQTDTPQTDTPQTDTPQQGETDT